MKGNEQQSEAVASTGSVRQNGSRDLRAPVSVPVFPPPPASSRPPELAGLSLDDLHAARLAYAVTEEGQAGANRLRTGPRSERAAQDEAFSRRAVAWVMEQPLRAVRAMERSVRDRLTAAAAYQDAAVADAMRSLPVPREGRDWPVFDEVAALAAEDDGVPAPVRPRAAVHGEQPARAP